MPYLRGDYYRGDYYRGDPGILGTIGNILKTGMKVASGAAAGFKFGPAGVIAGGAAGAAEATRANIQRETLAAGGNKSAYTPALKAAHAAAVARGPATGPPAVMTGGHIMVPGGMGMMLAGGPGHRRVHPNRSTYVTRGGGTSRWPVGLVVHPQGTELVPSRRMNVANPRALRRALRRVGGFGKIVKRSKRAVSRAASALGVHRGSRKKTARR